MKVFLKVLELRKKYYCVRYLLVLGDRHNVEYGTMHKLESHNLETFSLLVTTSKGESGL